MSGASWEVGESAHVERCHVPGRSGDVSQEKEQRCVPGTAWVCVTGRRSEGNVSQVKARVVCQMKRWGGISGRGSGDRDMSQVGCPRPREWGHVPSNRLSADGKEGCGQGRGSLERVSSSSAAPVQTPGSAETSFREPPWSGPRWRS